MADQNEERFRRRVSQPDKTVYTPLGAAEWAATNPQTIAARPQRVTCAVVLEVAGGGSARVATGGATASATNGILVDALNGPIVVSTENVGAISIYAIGGAECVMVQDEYLLGGTIN